MQCLKSMRRLVGYRQRRLEMYVIDFTDTFCVLKTSQVHIEQLGHVQKGCLQCAQQDVAGDTSCLEGLHKMVNNVQRANTRSLRLMVALVADIFLR